MLDQYVTFIKAHERMILAAGALGVVTVLGNHWMNVQSDKDKIAAALAQNTLQQQIDANKQLAAQAAQTQAEFKAIVDSVTRQEAVLAQTIASRNEGLKTQINANNNKSTADLGLRWKQLTGIPDSDMIISDSGVNINLDATRITVNQLEQIPVLKNNLTDTQQISDNKTVELNKANELITQQGNQINGLNLQIKDKDVACEKQVTSIKAEARKGKRNWFIAGFIAGIGTRLLGRL